MLEEKMWQMFCKYPPHQLKVCQQLTTTEILPPRLFHMCISNAASQKRSTKEPLFREDDCTWPVYLSRLISLRA